MKEPRYYTCEHCEERIDTLRDEFEECTYCGAKFHWICITEHKALCEYNSSNEESE